MDRTRVLVFLGVVLSFLFALGLLKYASQRMGGSNKYTFVLLSKSIINGADVKELEEYVGSRVVVKDIIKNVKFNEDGSAEITLTHSVLYLPAETVKYLKDRGIDLKNCINREIYALVRIEKGKGFDLYLVRPKALKIR